MECRNNRDRKFKSKLFPSVNCIVVNTGTENFTHAIRSDCFKIGNGSTQTIAEEDVI